MTTYRVHFDPGDKTVVVPGGTMIAEAARLAGIELNQPCGGQGRCGRCAVIVDETRSAVRRRSTMRLSAADVAAGYALACQTTVEGEAWITVPPQQAIERRLTTHKAAARVEVPFEYDPRRHQPIQRYFLQLDPPDLSDQTDDWSRVMRELARFGVENPQVSLALLREMPLILRGTRNEATEANPAPDETEATDIWHEAAEPWRVTAVVALDSWDRPNGPPQLLALL
ncbi:MAG: 2Fe-2S iron-sulfur cluster-binding protein, partial [Anaerolineae bacterium]|nr:2Fe-2S iron-sulfur cluster-binding protein [Anaerolineae bacterium]